RLARCLTGLSPLLPNLTVTSDARRSREQAWTLAWMFGDPHLLSLTQCDFVSRVPLVRMQLHGALAWSFWSLARKAQRRDRIDRLLQHLGVMHVGARDRHRQRQTMTIVDDDNDDVALGRQLATIGWVLASRFAPQEPAHWHCHVHLFGFRR